MQEDGSMDVTALIVVLINLPKCDVHDPCSVQTSRVAYVAKCWMFITLAPGGQNFNPQ